MPDRGASGSSPKRPRGPKVELCHGPDGFFALCACGWRGAASEDPDAALDTGYEHARPCPTDFRFVVFA